MGDPVFDYFAKTEMQAVASPGFEKRTVDAIEQLLDLIGKPVMLVVNSGVATSGWAVADARSKLVKGHRRSRTGCAARSITRNAVRPARDVYGA